MLKPVLGSQIQLGHPLANGLVGCWIFNEGGGNTVFDLSGNNNILSVASGTPTREPGKFGEGIEFIAASTEYFSINKALISTKPLTIIAWVKPFTIAADQTLLSIMDSGINTEGVLLHMSWDGVGEISAFEFEDNVGFTRAVATKNLSINTWHQVAVVFESDTLRHAYVDGDNKNTDTTLMNGMHNLNTTAIGALCRLGILGYWNGRVDHVILWNRVLSDSEIQRIYRNPFCMFERESIELWTAAIGGVPAPSNIIYDYSVAIGGSA